MFFGTKLIKYQVSFGDPLNLWGFYSLTAPHYGKGSICWVRKGIFISTLLKCLLDIIDYSLFSKSQEECDGSQCS